MTQLTLILILTILLGVSTSFFIVYIYFLKKQLKQFKNICKVIGEDLYQITTSTNVAPSIGSIQNMANLIKQIGEE